MTKSIRLITKSPTEKEHFLEESNIGYAKDLSRTYDLSLEEAKKMADSQIKYALDTKNGLIEVRVESIVDESNNNIVGGIWYNIDKENLKTHIYQIIIDEAHRGQGYGKQALSKVHEFCKTQNVTTVTLSVFGWNQVAFKLYESLGYEILRYGMQKDL